MNSTHVNTVVKLLVILNLFATLNNVAHAHDDHLHEEHENGTWKIRTF
jgi:hypothetical protein